jgi:hypothetical protein
MKTAMETNDLLLAKKIADPNSTWWHKELKEGNELLRNMEQKLAKPIPYLVSIN